MSRWEEDDYELQTDLILNIIPKLNDNQLKSVRNKAIDELLKRYG